MAANCEHSHVAERRLLDAVLFMLHRAKGKSPWDLGPRSLLHYFFCLLERSRMISTINPLRKDIMKTLITYAMVALLATVAISTAATNDNAMLEKENAAWQAFKDKKQDDFKKILSANLMAVYAEGFSDMQKELADMQKWDMKSFAISDYKVTSAGSDTVVTTYKVMVEGTYDGQDQSGSYNAGSVWKKQNGKWQAIFHTNVKEAPAGG